MRAQGYDGAANMSGTHREAKIRERIPTTQYVHSNAHVLNLAIAIVHSSLDVSVKTMMAFALRYSSQNG